MPVMQPTIQIDWYENCIKLGDFVMSYCARYDTCCCCSCLVCCQKSNIVFFIPLFQKKIELSKRAKTVIKEMKKVWKTEKNWGRKHKLADIKINVFFECVSEITHFSHTDGCGRSVLFFSSFG